LIRQVIRLLLKKILEIVVSLIFLVTLTFLLLKVLPGGPFDYEGVLNPLVKEKIREHWQIDQGLSSQVVSYLKSLSRGELGISMIRPEREVAEIISMGIQNTLLLNLVALFVIVIFAFGVSTLAVYYRDTWLETFIDQIILAFLSLPSLFWGPLLIYLFGFYWNLLPVALLSSPVHYILPLMTLCTRPTASLVRILKNSMIENVKQDYVRTAKAKGAGSVRILFNHVLRNSLIPFLSYGGPLLVSIFSGSFLVEVLFAIPGLGSEFVSSLNERDYTLIAGLTLFYGVLLILTNSLVDLLLRWADPRMRESL
jgi:oligopeptide transport system permease protein